ncbi:MAG: sigma-70 family RNA polymerase sigma factor [Phycisphaerae bacterium]|nr:sigma-70 family RNA polymerase sigma factor [Phycisphaerae bacterium]
MPDSLFNDSASISAAEQAAEQELLERLRANDAGAFESMIRLHGGRMLAVARRLLNNEDDARDAVQEALVSAFRSIGGFAGASRLSTWLHRIAVNSSLMKLRTRRRQGEVSIESLLPAYQDDGHRSAPVAEWTQTAEDVARSRETRAIVRDCISKLPENYRIVLMLRDIEELSTREAAEMLGIEESALKVRLHRARLALRTLLDERFRGNEA